MMHPVIVPRHIAIVMAHDWKLAREKHQRMLLHTTASAPPSAEPLRPPLFMSASQAKALAAEWELFRRAAEEKPGKQKTGV
ncbi:MAG TPA: hypothetical protein PKO06_02175 [Candidatus Ozemobacteraceae bacterium]|nr:hypothetical protein [Candidatus Ozemobacteraceae bacterium]